jgi:hypothetical protein
MRLIRGAIDDIAKLHVDGSIGDGQSIALRGQGLRRQSPNPNNVAL